MHRLHGQEGAGDPVARGVAAGGPRVDLGLPVFLVGGGDRRLGRQRAAPIFVARQDVHGAPGGRVALNGREVTGEPAGILRLGSHDLHAQRGHGRAEVAANPGGQLGSRVRRRRVDPAAVRLVLGGHGVERHPLGLRLLHVTGQGVRPILWVGEHGNARLAAVGVGLRRRVGAALSPVGPGPPGGHPHRDPSLDRRLRDRQPVAVPDAQQAQAGPRRGGPEIVRVRRVGVAPRPGGGDAEAGDLLLQARFVDRDVRRLGCSAPAGPAAGRSAGRCRAGGSAGPCGAARALSAGARRAAGGGGAPLARCASAGARSAGARRAAGGDRSARAGDSAGSAGASRRGGTTRTASTAAQGTAASATPGRRAASSVLPAGARPAVAAPPRSVVRGTAARASSEERGSPKRGQPWGARDSSSVGKAWGTLS